MSQDIILPPMVGGTVATWRVTENTRTLLSRKTNQIQYGWGFIAAQAIGRGNRDYRISTLYIEYENMAEPELSATIPSVDREEGVEYYQNLAMSGSRDFIRAAVLTTPDIGIASGFENYFTAGTDGNMLTFFTQTSGTQGFHGKTFSAAANSKIFGVALVATPYATDPTRDVVFARTYFDSADQPLKTASSQVGITWDIAFK